MRLQLTVKNFIGPQEARSSQRDAVGNELISLLQSDQQPHAAAMVVLGSVTEAVGSCLAYLHRSNRNYGAE